MASEIEASNAVGSRLKYMSSMSSEKIECGKEKKCCELMREMSSVELDTLKG